MPAIFSCAVNPAHGSVHLWSAKQLQTHCGYVAWVVGFGGVATLWGLLGMASRLSGAFSWQIQATTSIEDQPQTACVSRGVQDRLLACIDCRRFHFFSNAMQYQDALMSLAVWSLASWVLALMWMIIESVSCRLRPGTVWRKVNRLAWQTSVFGIAGCMLVDAMVNDRSLSSHACRVRVGTISAWKAW